MSTFFYFYVLRTSFGSVPDIGDVRKNSSYFNLHESHGRDFTACFMKPLDGFSQWFLTVFTTEPSRSVG